MDLGLEGARALVTGASSGLGAAVARELAREGALVAVAARQSDRLEATAAELGGVPVGVDLATPDGPAAAVSTAVEQLGGLDALLVSMGGPPAGTFDELSDADWQKAIDMTLWSTVRLIRAALPALRDSASTAAGRGAICIISGSKSIPR